MACLVLFELYFVASILPHKGWSFNLDLTNYSEYAGPVGSHFGFSVDFYQPSSQEVGIVVGAPRDNDELSQGGSVFLCSWTSDKGPCKKLSFNQTGNENIRLTDMIFMSHTSNQWLGATVRTYKSFVLACAPLFHWNVLQGKDEAMNTPVGNCQLLNVLTGEMANYAPCRGYEVEEIYKRKGGYQDRRYCEAGFSLDITKTGRVVLGAPGGYFFQGQIITAPLQNIMSSGRIFSPIHHLRDETMSTEMFYQYDIYLGYSVASGQFSADNVPDYVVGAPLDMHSTGSVKIFNGSTVYPKIMLTLTGFQVSSYYGHCVTVTDINNDGRDDILVGAPLFMEHLSSQKLREVGQVYVYLQREGNRLSTKPDQTLSGTWAYGRFGISVASLGDIDRDGFNDVAVGASGSGEGGLVFIFMGLSDGLDPRHKQVIESPFPSLGPAPAFGFSMKGGIDIDNNGYPDLIVGAWGADRVAIYRAKTLVKTKVQLSFFPDFLQPNEKLCQLGNNMVSCFHIFMCIRVSGYRIPEEIVLNTELQLDKMKPNKARRTLLLQSHQPYNKFELSIKRDTGAVCRNITAYLLTDFKDKLSPIFISLNYSLANSQSAMLHGQTVTVGQTQIVLDCGDDNICVPDLKLSAQADTDPLLIGDEKPALLIFSAENHGEGAYETELFVHLPPQTHYQGVLSSRENFTSLLCGPKKENGSVIVICELGNPMKNGQKIKAGLYFSMGGLEEVEAQVLFRLQIKSKNSQNPVSNIVAVKINVQALASLEMRGVSSPSECVLPIAKWEPKSHPMNLDDVGPTVEHVYELRNKGPSPVNVRLGLHFPVEQNGSYVFYVSAYASEELLTCYTNSFTIDPLELIKQDLLNTTVAPVHHINKRELQQNQEQLGQHRRSSVHVVDLTKFTPSNCVQGSLCKGPTVTACLYRDLNSQSVGIYSSTLSTVQNCSSGEPCLILSCEAAGLQRDARAIVRVTARLWVHSFLERPYVNYVLLSSAHFEVVDVPSRIQPKNLPKGQAETNTTVVWRRPDGQEEVPVWWIVVSIIAGLLLLALLSIVFWKIGFFKRNRPPTDEDDGDSTDNLNAE